ncbi:hypothetical protein Nepgr_016247 [Nepenthes gracilis]|uniref:NAD-dependent epimerase/dehydratase domain-containing protein n=1 Tax=Nepenthes gracilis TaxID=150966 RepID=A0AAD3SQ53_NEPGR|nr:hypothetical protein Nepgr_016247 [Nepenthes gracilis]
MFLAAWEENYVRSEVTEPAIRGTLNLLKSCLGSKTVRRVVFTSSISTITARDDKGNWRPLVDESCRTATDNVYVLSKLLTEEAAVRFADENGMSLVSVITTTVAGQFLTSAVPTSIRVLLSPATGDHDLLPIIAAVNSRIGSICLVHIHDICNAHIFLMQHLHAKGLYICSAYCCRMSQLLNLLAQAYPTPNNQRIINLENGESSPEISSKKLKDLGFRYEYGLEEIIVETISCCLECGYLPPVKKYGRSASIKQPGRVVIVAMDIAAGVLSIEAEISMKILLEPRSQVEGRWRNLFSRNAHLLWISKCKQTRNDAFSLGVAGALFSTLAHILANVVGGCECISSVEALEKSPSKRRRMFACLIGSWCVVAVGLPLLITGVVANSKSTRLCAMSNHHMLSGGICCFVHALLCCLWCITFSTMDTQI